MPRLTLGSRTYTADNNTEQTREFLLFEGVEVESTNYPYDHEGKIGVSCYESLLHGQLSDLRVRDVKEALHRLSVSPSQVHSEELDLITVVQEFEVYPAVEGGDLVFACVVDFHWHKWNKPWSPLDFVTEMVVLVSQFPEVEDAYGGPEGGDDFTAIVEFAFEDEDRKLTEIIEENWQTTMRFVKATEKSLQAKVNENSLLSHFNFHPALQGACEEYLWSFVQFLKDVGVEATAELKQDQVHPGEVLFSVTPTRGKAVLGKIKQALDLYISLAGVNQFEFDANASIQMERLESRVLFLQSQLKSFAIEARLREATIQAHETTIQAQVMALDKVNASNVFLLARVDELQAEKAKKVKDEREFFGGIIRLGNWNTKGFIVNLPRLLDQVRGIMIEPDEPTITGASMTEQQLPGHLQLRTLPPKRGENIHRAED